MKLIDKWIAMQAVQGIDSVATLRDGDPVIRMSAVEHVLENLPETEPERKVGRWIPCPQSASWLYVYKCSECGGYLQISDVDGNGYKANYCSYCGAKMERGEQE